MAAVTGYSTSEAKVAGSSAFSNSSRLRAADGSEFSIQTEGNVAAVETIELSNFGFDASIPAGAVITSVVIEENCHSDPGNQGRIGAMDIAYVLGGVVDTYHGPAYQISTAAATYSFDVTGDRAWTRADLLDSNFKVRIRLTRTSGGSTNAFGYWDFARAVITYTTGPTPPTTGQLHPRGWKTTAAPSSGQLFPRRVST